MSYQDSGVVSGVGSAPSSWGIWEEAFFRVPEMAMAFAAAVFAWRGGLLDGGGGEGGVGVVVVGWGGRGGGV